MKSLLVAVLCLLSISTLVPVFAIDYSHSHMVNSPNVCGDSICGHSTQFDREKLFNHFLQFNHLQTAPPNINYFFTLIETPTGASLVNIVLSPDNATALKNNVGIFTACGSFDHGLCTPPLTTTASPSIGYCQVAMTILINQDGYLNRTFTIAPNGTLIKDLTHFVYPDSCLAETGQNPYSPITIKPTPIPEFGGLAYIVTGLSFAVIISMYGLISRSKF